MTTDEVREICESLDITLFEFMHYARQANIPTYAYPTPADMAALRAVVAHHRDLGSLADEWRSQKKHPESAGHEWVSRILDARPLVPDALFEVALHIGDKSVHGVLEGVPQRLLAEWSGLDVREVRRALDSLCFLGWLTRERHPKQSTTIYRIAYPATVNDNPKES